MKRPFFATMVWATLAVIPLALNARSSDLSQIARRATPTPTPSPTGTPGPTPSPTPYLQNGDRAYLLIGGEWSCSTFAGTKFTRSYRRDEDAVSIIAETNVRIAGHTGKLVEVYRKHADANKWVASLVNGEIVAVASPWHSGDWIFAGHESELGHDVQMRMIYRAFGENAFRREFELSKNGHFASYAGEECRRRAD